MNATEVARIQQYLREKFSNNMIKLMMRDRVGDSAEVAIGEEFIGVVYKDEDEGEVSYALHITVLDMDLPEL